MAAAVFFVNDVATQIAQWRLQHIENEFRTGRSAGWARAQFRAELMLMFSFGEIPKHVGRRSEKDEPPTFVQEDRLVKNVENFGARLVNREAGECVVGAAPLDCNA